VKHSRMRNSFTALSHHIDSLAKSERGVGVEEENVAAVIQSTIQSDTSSS